MPKSRAELLRRELEKVNLELLDIYSFKDADYIRVRHKASGKVLVYESKKKVQMLATLDDVKALALDIAKRFS